MKLKVGGQFTVEHWRQGKIIDKRSFHNGVTAEGLYDILDIMFVGGTQHSDWFFGLIEGASPTLVAGDTMSSHAGWTENTDYNESVRGDYNPTLTLATIYNATHPSFTMNASATISGVFITSDNTPGGTSGKLWATGLFEDGNLSVESSDIVKTYYELTASA